MTQIETVVPPPEPPPAELAAAPRPPLKPILPPGHPGFPTYDPAQPDRVLYALPAGVADAAEAAPRLSPRLQKIRALIAADPDNLGLLGKTFAERLALLVALRIKRPVPGISITRRDIMQRLGAKRTGNLLDRLRTRAAADSETRENLKAIEDGQGFDPNDPDAEAWIAAMVVANVLTAAMADAIRDAGKKQISRAEAEALADLTLQDLERAG